MELTVTVITVFQNSSLKNYKPMCGATFWSLSTGVVCHPATKGNYRPQSYVTDDFSLSTLHA